MNDSLPRRFNTISPSFRLLEHHVDIRNIHIFQATTNQGPPLMTIDNYKVFPISKHICRPLSNVNTRIALRHKTACRDFLTHCCAFNRKCL